MSRFIRRPREVFYIAFNNRTAVRVSRLSLTVTEQRLLKNTRGGGVLLRILGGAVPPDSPNPDPISTKTCHFSHQFSGLASKKLRHHYLDKNSIKKDFRTSISNSHISLSFLLIWNWRDEYVLPSRTIPDSSPKWTKWLPVFRSKRRKNPTLWSIKSKKTGSKGFSLCSWCSFVVRKVRVRAARMLNQGRNRKRRGRGLLPSTSPPLFSFSSSVQLSRGVSYLTNHKLRFSSYKCCWSCYIVNKEAKKENMYLRRSGTPRLTCQVPFLKLWQFLSYYPRKKFPLLKKKKQTNKQTIDALFYP